MDEASEFGLGWVANSIFVASISTFSNFLEWNRYFSLLLLPYHFTQNRMKLFIVLPHEYCMRKFVFHEPLWTYSYKYLNLIMKTPLSRMLSSTFSSTSLNRAVLYFRVFQLFRNPLMGNKLATPRRLSPRRVQLCGGLHWVLEILVQ